MKRLKRKRKTMSDSQLLNKTIGEWQPTATAPLDYDVLVLHETTISIAWKHPRYKIWISKISEKIATPDLWMLLPDLPKTNS